MDRKQILQNKSQSGMVLIIVLILMLMLSLIGIASIMTSNTEIDIAGNLSHQTSAFYLADAGAERALSILKDSVDWRTGFPNQALGGGSYNVTLADSTTDLSLEDRIVLTSYGKSGESRSAIEIVLGQGAVHPLYNHAIYAGNFAEYDPNARPQVWTAQLDLGGCGTSGDVVNGDIFFNGNVDISCSAQVNGSVEAGGTVTGNAPTGGETEGVGYLEPPDLLAMQYETISDFYINGASPWDASGHLPSTDPRHIFVKEYRADLATFAGFNFDNTNYFFGDPYEGANIDRVSVSADGNQKTYYIDGNLWVEPQGTTSQLINSPPTGTQITIVVRGNIYFSDDLLYSNPAVDGIAFVAMSDGESYTDQNDNNQYDSGEPILHDDGDGIYEGNREGSGNVNFGDPNGGGLGNISGFIYAENNFEDHVLDGPDGDPQNFGVNGILSAGNLFNVNRDYAGGHAPMIINYDNRLQNGTLSLPNLPRATSIGSLTILSWREIRY